MNNFEAILLKVQGKGTRRPRLAGLQNIDSFALFQGQHLAPPACLTTNALSVNVTSTKTTTFARKRTITLTFRCWGFGARFKY